MSLLENYVQNNFDKPIRECTDQELYKVLLDLVKDQSGKLKTFDSKKKLYYVSAEFLIGKLLSNNLLNLGIYDEVNDELIANGKNLMDIEQAENEPSLGNGGLGRLAACFLDSISTLGMNGDGVGLNYHFGLFQQVFRDNRQITTPDSWITQDSWLIKNRKTYEVQFKDFTVTSSLYDIDVLGYEQNRRNRLRLFDLESVTSDIIEEGTINFDMTNIRENLTLFLYPDDSNRQGELLRIFQQYFMVSNAAQLIIDEAMEKGSNLHDLPDYAVIQTNDTHPALIIPEMVRLLMENDIEFEEAATIVEKMVAFTNHTILAEALEKWPIDYLEDVCPHIVPIIRRLDERKKDQFPDNPAVSIIDNYNTVHMASLSIHYGYSVNGVANLHTSILKTSELRPFADIYPDKFNNKTNGITFRRWIMDCNKTLSDFLDNKIGEDWRKKADLTPLEQFKDDPKTANRLRAIKFQNKQRLNKFLQENQGVTINEHSIIDTQIKRIHEYKRQQMNLLWVIYKYFDIKDGNVPDTPITVLFGGKAAPAYTIAQDIIHAILTISELIAADKDVSPHLQVVMVENYNVTAAQYLIPATDISEQISLASKEASGTGNMKFMLNGALTLTTFDGSNIELHHLVGAENVYTFGRNSDDIVNLYATDGYNAFDYYNRPTVKRLVDFLLSPGMLYLGHEENLRRLHNDMMHKDYFMALIDIEEYIAVKEKMLRDYEDHEEWMRKVIINISKAGYFSSDRTIQEYNDDIWHLDQDKERKIDIDKLEGHYKMDLLGFD